MVLIIGPSGIETDVDAVTASGLVDGGHARYVEHVTADPDLADPETTSANPPQGAGEEGAQPPVADPAQTGTVAKPKGNASLEEWTAYAASHGVTVDGLTRDEIRAKFKD